MDGLVSPGTAEEVLLARVDAVLRPDVMQVERRLKVSVLRLIYALEDLIVLVIEQGRGRGRHRQQRQRLVLQVVAGVEEVQVSSVARVQ